MFDTITVRVLLLRLQNRFLILLVNTVLFFTVNKEIAAIDESSSVSCRAAGISGLVVRHFWVSSTRAFLAAFLRSSRTPGSVPGLGERCGVRVRVDESESSRSLQIPTTFFSFLLFSYNR